MPWALLPLQPPPDTGVEGPGAQLALDGVRDGEVFAADDGASVACWTQVTVIALVAALGVDSVAATSEPELTAPPPTPACVQ